MTRYRHVRLDGLLDAGRDVAELAGGLEALVKRFAYERRPLDDFGIVRQIGLIEAELNKLKLEVRFHFHEAA